MSKIKVSDVMVDVLEKAGVRRCYGIVGDTLNHFTDSLTKSQIEWVHMRHEEAGALAAGAEAQISHRLTACAGSCGPGSLHFINGIYEAHRNRSPVVMIASQLPTNQPGYMDFPQHVDYKPAFKDCSVFCEEILSPEQARYVMTQACQAALNKRGVAVVIVPSNISKETINDDIQFETHHPSPQLIPSREEFYQLKTHLAEGGKITIYAGAGCEFAHDQVVALSHKLQAPVVHTSRAKDFIEYDNPNCMGMTGMFGTRAGFEAIRDCDTLLVLGADFAWYEYYPNRTKIIQIDEDPTHLGRRTPITFGVAGHIAPTLNVLLGELEDNTDSAWLEKCIKGYESARKDTLAEEKPGRNGLIHPQYVVGLLNKYADSDAILTADGGSPMVWSLRHFETHGMRRTLPSLLHGTMANALPQALGLKKAYPHRQIISLSGDGGLAMLMGELLTVAQEQIDVKIVVLNNGSLNFVELEQKVEGLVDSYTKLQNPDFGKMASVMGMLGITHTSSDGLEAAVQKFLSHEGPALLDVHTTPNELVMPPNPTPAQAAGFATYAGKAAAKGRVGEVVDLIKENVFNRKGSE